MGNCSSTSNCNPCGPNYDAINQLATKTASYARQANTYAINAENSWLEFNALYLGAFAVAPTVDNEGDPLQVGALYWNSVLNNLWAWDGTSWMPAVEGELYLGGFAAAPTLDNEGNPLQLGNLYWNTASNNLWAYNGTSWVETEFNEFTPFLATGTTFARNLVTRSADVINVKDFGAVGDGAADDRTAFTNAMNAASTTKKKLYIPAGNYKIDVPAGGTCFVPPPDVTMAGDGKVNTRLLFNHLGGGTCFFVQHPNLSISNLAIETTVPASALSFIFLISNSNFTVTDCLIDGKVTNSGSVESHQSYGFFHLPTGTQNNLLVQNCVITRQTWPFIKDNAATSTQKNIRILSNKFITNYRNDCGLNSPKGIMEDVIIDGNTFEDNRCNITAGHTQALGIALASVSNVIISNNIIKGQYTDGIHIEEKSYNVKIIGNNISITKGGATSKCIEFNANSIGGAELNPQYVIISSNNLIQYGTSREAGTFGIVLQVSEIPGSEVIIADNIMHDFETGIYSVCKGESLISITNNIIYNCDKGFNFQEGKITAFNNSTKLCNTAIFSNTTYLPTDSILVKEHTFIDCTNNVTVVPETFIILINPKFVFSEFNHVAPATLKYLFPANIASRFYGDIMMNVVNATGSFYYCYNVFEIKWDGTTFTSTEIVQREVGFAAAPFVGSSQLGVEVYNTLSLSNVGLQIDFNGTTFVSQ